MKRKYFTQTRVAGFQYGEGLLCYDELKVGAELTMVRDLKNLFDPNAIALYKGEYKIGYLPKSGNEGYANLMDMGWTDLFEVRINKVDPDEHPEEQIGITIFIKENIKKDNNAAKGE